MIAHILDKSATNVMLCPPRCIGSQVSWCDYVLFPGIVDLGHLVKMFSVWFLTVKLLPTFPFEINHYIGDTWKLWKVYFSSNFHPLNQWSFVCNNYDYSVCLIVTFYFPLSFYTYSLKATVRKNFPFFSFIYISMDSIFILS